MNLLECSFLQASRPSDLPSISRHLKFSKENGKLVESKMMYLYERQNYPELKTGKAGHHRREIIRGPIPKTSFRNVGEHHNKTLQSGANEETRPSCRSLLPVALLSIHHSIFLKELGKNVVISNRFGKESGTFLLLTAEDGINFGKLFGTDQHQAALEYSSRCKPCVSHFVLHQWQEGVVVSVHVVRLNRQAAVIQCRVGTQGRAGSQYCSRTPRSPFQLGLPAKQRNNTVI